MLIQMNFPSTTFMKKLRKHLLARCFIISVTSPNKLESLLLLSKLKSQKLIRKEHYTYIHVSVCIQIEVFFIRKQITLVDLNKQGSQRDTVLILEVFYSVQLNAGHLYGDKRCILLGCIRWTRTNLEEQQCTATGQSARFSVYIAKYRLNGIWIHKHNIKVRTLIKETRLQPFLKDSSCLGNIHTLQK